MFRLKRRKSPYQMEPSEVIQRARELRIPDARVFGAPNSLKELFSQGDVVELRRKVIEQELWNVTRMSWIVALLFCIGVRF